MLFCRSRLSVHVNHAQGQVVKAVLQVSLSLPLPFPSQSLCLYPEQIKNVFKIDNIFKIAIVIIKIKVIDLLRQ